MGGFGSRGGIKKRTEQEAEREQLEEVSSVEIVNLLETEIGKSSKAMQALISKLASMDERDKT